MVTHIGGTCQPYLAIDAAHDGRRVARVRRAAQPALVGGLCICGPGVPLPGMPFHKFKIGQRVSYQPSRSNFPVRWVVTALVPAVDGDLKYRIHRDDAPEDLVVSEKHLRETRDFDHLARRDDLRQEDGSEASLHRTRRLPGIYFGGCGLPRGWLYR
jgi:hypothetical protein